MTTNIDRRAFIASAGALAGAIAVPSPAIARMPMTKAQAPGFFRRKLGEFEVTALLDGDLTLEPKLFSGDAREIEAVAARSFMTTPVRSHVNAFAINTGERLYLVDTGTGGLMGPSLGRANANLVLAGIDPAQVDAILLTHIHPDHFGGMTVQGKPVFRSADVFVSEADARFWLSVESAAKAPAVF
jgi:glyoxylase-like metal-dependent hydrolase (beta-lactamase superfamily II)